MKRIIPLLSLLILNNLLSAGWQEVVHAELGSGWQEVEIRYAYNAGGGWKYLPEAETWIYMAESPEVLVQGSPISTPSHSYYISRHEVSWTEWQKVRTWSVANGYDIGEIGQACSDNHPVHWVNWYDAVKWCNAKSEMEGLQPAYVLNSSTYKSGEHTPIWNLQANGYRLPTEAEWQHAASGGNLSADYTYCGSNILDDVGWFRGNSTGGTCSSETGHGTWPIALKQANELGLYDMSGNVWEWCWETNLSSHINPNRAFRGGSMHSESNYCTPSAPGYIIPTYRGNSSGFRFVRTATE